MAAGQADDGHRHLTTLEGWRQFTADAPVAPELLPDREWQCQHP